jgi:hypothetical protein
MMSEKEKMSGKPGKEELDALRKLQENPNDVTGILFDLFFNKDFKGNIDIKKED